jgi:hypothetical protein
MLLISDETLDLIAGGTASGEASRGSIPIVTITGYLPPEGSGGGGGGWDGGGGGEGSGGSSPVSTTEPPQNCLPLHTSPIPASAPRDVDMNGLRNTMLDVASQIKALDANIEHGALVVRSANGNLRVGEMAHGVEGSITIGIQPQPGDVIVGYIHSHPYNGIDQKTPSNHDIKQMAELRKFSITDPGMMMYILDNESGDVYEYSSNVKKNPPLGNNVTDDVRACPR